MITVVNTRIKLIWEPGQSWMLHVDNRPVGSWVKAQPWERGIQGRVDAEIYRIEVVR